MGARVRDEGGQVLPLMVLVALAAGGACLLLGRVGGAAVARAQARTAADAAALAGAAGGRDEAARLAAANGARLTLYEPDGGTARVEVVLGSPPSGAEAGARATREAAPGHPGPAPALRAALARAAQLLGHPVPTTPWVPPGRPGGPTAHGGERLHRLGLAVDVAPEAVDELAPVAAEAGLCRPRPEAEPLHFELAPPPPRPCTGAGLGGAGPG